MWDNTFFQLALQLDQTNIAHEIRRSKRDAQIKKRRTFKKYIYFFWKAILFINNVKK